jgi:hypothetical protein
MGLFECSLLGGSSDFARPNYTRVHFSRQIQVETHAIGRGIGRSEPMHRDEHVTLR